MGLPARKLEAPIAPAGPPAGAHRLGELFDAFNGDTYEARKHSAHRWKDELRLDSRRYMHAGEWWVPGSARLDHRSKASGMRVDVWLAHGRENLTPEFPVPQDYEKWTAREREARDGAIALERERRRFREDRPELIERRADEAFQREHGISGSAMRRRLKRLRAGLRITATGRPPLNPSAGMTPEDRARLLELMRCDREPALKVCWRIWSAEIRKTGREPLPYHTVRRRIENDDDFRPFFLHYHRRGDRRWENELAPLIQRDYSALHVHQMWVADHHRCDVVVKHKGRFIRPWLTVWMDMRSRAIVGWAFTAGPNADVILAAFYMGAITNGYGVPAEVLIDGGMDFNGASLLAVFARCATVVHKSLPYRGRSKPVERFFRTFTEQFCKAPGIPEVAGYIGRNPENRPEDVHKRIRAGEIQVATFEEFASAASAWVRDVYNRQAHGGDGMDGRSPAQVLAEVEAIPKRTAPQAIFDRLLMREVKATVTRKGVRYGNHFYGQTELAILRRIKAHDREVKLLIPHKLIAHLDGGATPGPADFVIVTDLEGREICKAYCQRIRGANAAQVAEGAKRLTEAKRLARGAGKALRDRFRPAESHVLEVLAEDTQRNAVAATGTNDSRPVQLLSAAARMAPMTADGRTPSARPAFPDSDSDAGRGIPRPQFGAKKSGWQRMIEKARAEEQADREAEAARYGGSDHAESEADALADEYLREPREPLPMRTVGESVLSEFARNDDDFDPDTVVLDFSRDDELTPAEEEPEWARIDFDEPPLDLVSGFDDGEPPDKPDAESWLLNSDTPEGH